MGKCLVESFDGSLKPVDDSFNDIPLLDDRAEWKVDKTMNMSKGKGKEWWQFFF